jgi:DNA-binding NtrC family response regulator
MPHLFFDPVPQRRKTVLCVDDESIGLLMRKLLLESCGYAVVTASTREEALSALARHHVDVVVADYYLCESTGDTLAADISIISPELPVIVYSGASDIPIAWAAAVVNKPAEPEQLCRVIEDVIATRIEAAGGSCDGPRGAARPARASSA